MSATDLPSARNAVAAGLEAPRTTGLFSDTITNILSALSAMPLADRLALARALVPGMAVVERVEWGDALHRAQCIVQGKPTWRRFIDGTPLANDIAVWMANFYTELLTAAEKETTDEQG